MEPVWLRIEDGAAMLDVWVVPGAARTEVVGTHDGALRIRVAAPPEKGRANRDVARFLKKKTGGKVAIVKGHGSRRKTIRIGGVRPVDIQAALGEVGSD